MMLEISAVWCMDLSSESSTLSFILARWGSQPAYPDEESMYFLYVVTPTSAAERVCPVVHKVNFVWHSLTGRMLCRELNFKMPAQLSCRSLSRTLHVCVPLWFSRPVSCIFAMSLKPESINPTIPVLGVTSMFGYLFLCWPGYTEHPFSLSRKTSCPVLVIQWKYKTVSSTALFAKLQIISLPLPGAHSFMLHWLGTVRHLHSECTATCPMIQRTFQWQYLCVDALTEPIWFWGSCSKCLTLMGVDNCKVFIFTLWAKHYFSTLVLRFSAPKVF